MLEDVVTTGGSSLKAIQHARDFGLQVDRIITIIDRQAGGKEKFEAEGVKFFNLLTLSDLGIDAS